MGLVVRGESWKTLGAAFHTAQVVLDPPPSGQYVVLSTCNRKEMFCWESPQDVRRTQDSVAAIAYLYRIAAGLESMVLGEYQILGQVREAFAAARAEGHVGKELDRIFRDAISCAKRVKTELDLGAVPPSVCRAGMDEVERRTGCRGKRVFVIGSGRTGTLAAELAAARSPSATAVRSGRWTSPAASAPASFPTNRAIRRSPPATSSFPPRLRRIRWSPPTGWS